MKLAHSENQSRFGAGNSVGCTCDTETSVMKLCPTRVEVPFARCEPDFDYVLESEPTGTNHDPIGGPNDLGGGMAMTGVNPDDTYDSGLPVVSRFENLRIRQDALHHNSWQDE